MTPAPTTVEAPAVARRAHQAPQLLVLGDVRTETLNGSEPHRRRRRH